MSAVTRRADAAPQRRTVLLAGAGAGAAVLLAGCTLNNPFDSSKTPAAKAVRDLAPDVAIAVRAVVLIREQQYLLTETVIAFPALATRLAPLRALHQTHIDTLVAAVPKQVDTSAKPASVEVPTSRQNALLNAAAGETGLRDQLDNLALTAESGQFARLLGSIGAAISQHAVSLRALAGIRRDQSAPRLAPAAGGTGSVQALQETLAAEHAALSVYGFLGAQASQSRQPKLYDALETAYRTHRKRRDQLTVMISARGATPVPAAVAYDLPKLTSSASELTDAALLVEHRIALTYGQMVENTADAERRWALVALDNAAVGQLEFRGTPEMFPGSAPRS
jgi:hypothetical protein